MSREIKFRVWVEAPDGEKGMHYPKLISFGSGQLSWATLADDSVIKNNGWYTKREVMQYTGLKTADTNTEIYEGDVLEHREMRGAKKEPLRHVVTCVVNSLSGESSFSLPKPLHKFEVIGNIYDNPELLKETV